MVRLGRPPQTPPSDAKLLHATAHPDEGLRLWHDAATSRYWHRYADGTAFASDGLRRTVDASWPEPLTLANACTYFMGPIAGLWLRLDGASPLHASVVRIGDRAVAFAGAASAGKSTLAAALNQRGCPVLSDDICVVQFIDGVPWVTPGYPRVNLWPESGAALFGDARSLPALVPRHATFDKQYLQLEHDATFEAAPCPLGAIYIGEPTDVDGASVEAVGEPEALRHLVGNAYAPYLLNRVMRAADFSLFSQLASAAPMRRLKARRDLNQLDMLADAVLADAIALLDR
ncbi:MAG: hypothetical protein AAF458_10575 [Pseudomonadota bacterium]